MQDKREVYSTPNRMRCTTELGCGMSLSLPCIRGCGLLLQQTRTTISQTRHVLTNFNAVNSTSSSFTTSSSNVSQLLFQNGEGLIAMMLTTAHNM